MSKEKRSASVFISSFGDEVIMDDHTQHTDHNHSGHDQKPGQDPSRHARMDHSKHTMERHAGHQGHDVSTVASPDHSAHAGHGTDHTGHEQMFRVRFWWSLLLSIPVLLYSEMIQMWLGITPPAFAFGQW